MTVTGFAAIYLDPTEPARLREVTYAVLLAYALYSLGVLAFVHGSARLTPRHGQTLHALDILWTSVLTFVSEGPVSPFFLFFLFVVLAAAYRWGFRETVATAAITVAVFLVETAIASVGPWNRRWLASIDFELNRTILRVAYLLITGFLLGYLAEEEKQSQAEVAAIADATRLPRVDLGLGGSVTAVARGLLSTFDAVSVVVVLHEFATRRTVLWELARSPDAADSARTRRLELDAQQQSVWLFPDAGRAWHASASKNGGGAVVRVTEPDVWPLKRLSVELPSAFLTTQSFRTVTAVNMGLSREWQGRVYVFDAAQTGGRERSLHFLEALAEHVTPALTNVFLLRRLRARAGAAERARVARELHDGTIQALFGIEMKIEALRRATERAPADLDAELEAVQQVIRLEVLALRDLMQALRPIEIDGDQLPDVLATVVERFRRDTGVSARFISGGGRPVLLPATALEVVRIVQEALVNVRKHSRARNVLVRLNRDDHTCTIVIEDDGCGFGFEGRLTGEELDQGRIGPAIIKERARIAGARLAVDSTPGEGARVELTFSEAAHG